MKLLGIISVGFGISDQLQMRFLCIRHICQTLEKKLGVQWDSTSAIYRLKEGLSQYCITEFGILIKLVRPIKMCLNETYSKKSVYRNIYLIYFLFKMA
jgi:hypothetical protein